MATTTVGELGGQGVAAAPGETSEESEELEGAPAEGGTELSPRERDTSLLALVTRLVAESKVADPKVAEATEAAATATPDVATPLSSPLSSSRRASPLSPRRRKQASKPTPAVCAMEPSRPAEARVAAVPMLLLPRPSDQESPPLQRTNRSTARGTARFRRRASIETLQAICRDTDVVHAAADALYGKHPVLPGLPPGDD
eukprot:TRINITY_DN4873_c0_g1_i3.p1 TRINITY_DN4873_c0_g1~~TRINITY_DN4873_c0_g1_i3.p1  ORF type:complete len:200 (+),score=24.91 TRINITY_DN4873_c0_g1_i3:343-942(+)